MEETLKKPAVRGSLALLCCVLWGSAFPCVKIGYELLHINTAGGQILFAGYRLFLAGILTFLVGCVIEKRILIMRKTSIPYILRQGFLQTTIQYMFFYIGMAHTTGTKGSVINACNAFVSIIVAHFIMKNDKLTCRKAIGCLLGFAGIIIINLAPGAWGSGFSLMGEGCIIICTVVYGISTVIMKMISHMESAMTITAYQLSFGGAVLILTGRLMGGEMGAFDSKAAMLLAYMVFLSMVAFSIWTMLLKSNPVGKVAIFGCSIPIFGVLLSAILLNEQIFTFQNLTALICVSAGILIINQTEKQEV